MIYLKNVSKTYINKKNNVNALKSVSMELPSKGLVTIVGSSGSGKTSLLNIIGTLDKPTKGLVKYTNYENITSKQLLNNIIAVIDQEGIFLNGLSVVDNIKFFSNIQGKELSSDVIFDEMKSVGLDDCFDKQIYELSFGQKQRVSFLRSTLKENHNCASLTI